MNKSLDIIPTTANWIKSILKIVPKLVLTEGLKPKLNLVINLIRLRQRELKTEFENGLINFKILFLKAEKVSEFLNFKSKLLHSMTVDGKKEFIKKLCLPLKSRMLLLVLVLYALLILGSILKRYFGDELHRFRLEKQYFESKTKR